MMYEKYIKIACALLFVAFPLDAQRLIKPLNNKASHLGYIANHCAADIASVFPFFVGLGTLGITGALMGINGNDKPASLVMSILGLQFFCVTVGGIYAFFKMADWTDYYMFNFEYPSSVAEKILVTLIKLSMPVVGSVYVAEMRYEEYRKAVAADAQIPMVIKVI